MICMTTSTLIKSPWSDRLIRKSKIFADMRFSPMMISFSFCICLRHWISFDSCDDWSKPRLSFMNSSVWRIIFRILAARKLLKTFSVTCLNQLWSFSLLLFIIRNRSFSFSASRSSLSRK